MSGAQTSPFPDQNQLMAANAQQLANIYAPERNRLFVQDATQKAAMNEMAAMSSASQGLLSLPDEATRAAEYPKTVAYLQSLGFAKNAPPTYPGEQTLQMIRARGLPVEQQFNLGLTGPSPVVGQIADIYRNATGGGAGAAAGAGGGTGPAVPRDPNAPTIGQQANNPGNLSAGVPGSTGFITAADGQKVGVFPDVPTGVAAHAYQLARYGAQGIKTVQDAVDRWVSVPGKDNTAYANAVAAKLGVKPGDPINLADPAVQKAFILAQQPYESGRAWLNPADVDAGVAMASNPNFGKGAAARLGGVNVAGPGAPTATLPAVAAPSPAVPAAPAIPPAAGGTVAEGPGNQGLINRLTSVGGAQPPAAPAPAEPAAPVVPAAPAEAPIVPAPAPASAPAQAAATSALPHATEVPTGLASQNFQRARALEAEAARIEMLASQAGPKDLRTQQFAAKAAADLRNQAAELKATDTFVQTQEGQLNARTNQLINPAAPNAHYVWDEGKGAYVDTTGIHPPVTPPSPRSTYVPGTGLVQSKPGGGAIVVAPMNPAGISTQKAAEAAGTAAGTAGGKLVSQLADQGRNSAQAIGNIDYGLGQLAKAAAGGVPTGYFSDALANAAAMAKSLGIDTTALGVKPEAVGDIQTAQKTLAVISGAILQQAIGKGSAITDAKIEHFIHAQPGIQTDPQAVNRVLNWARSQFVYEREMAAAGMKDVDPATGTLPAGWQAQYYDKHGFAPIYNPETGHMEQPDSRAPGRESPATTETAPVNPANRETGKIYSTPKGPMKWTGTGWMPGQ